LGPQFLIVILLFFPFSLFSGKPEACESYCTQNSVIQSAIFDFPEEAAEPGVVVIKGAFFPNCKENVGLKIDGIPLKVLESTPEQTIATKDNKDLVGNFKLIVKKKLCPVGTRFAEIDVTLSAGGGSSDPTPRGLLFNIESTTALPIYPFSYAEIDVAWGSGKTPISGGYKFSTYGLKVVESYPIENNWHFKVYNDEDITSVSNVFYTVCGLAI